MNNRKLVLENGQVFYGVGFGDNSEVVAEIIYNTAVVGYQEIISDPVNCNKIVCMTYPLIGNYGLTDEDYESKHISIKGLIVREYNEIPSNFRYTRTLEEVMFENNVCGISQVDTRNLMKIIRQNKIMKAIICDVDKPLDECLKAIADYQEHEDLVRYVTSKKVWFSRTPNPIYNVAVIDLGTKLNLIKGLNKVGCNVISFPYTVTKEEILKYKPNGIVISSGPGDPNVLKGVIELIKSLKGLLPIFGIGLGCEIIALAYDCEVIKMDHGHHGCNYPVKNIASNKIEITSQNHLYSIVENTIENSNLVITHKNVISNEVEGFMCENDYVIGIQFDPIVKIDEQSENNFEQFINLIKTAGGKKNA